MTRGWPWDRWDVLDWIALGLILWMLLAVAVALLIGATVRLADARAAGRLRHAPPAGWLERRLPAAPTPTPPADSRIAGGVGGAGAGRRPAP